MSVFVFRMPGSMTGCNSGVSAHYTPFPRSLRQVDHELYLRSRNHEMAALASHGVILVFHIFQIFYAIT